MTLKKSTALILQNEPSAIYINLSRDPSVKSLLPTIKSSSKLIVLDEADDYIIVAKAPTKIQRGQKSGVLTTRLSKNIPIQGKRCRILRKKDTCFTQFLSSIGIQANPIKQSNESKDRLHIVNASGIIL